MKEKNNLKLYKYLQETNKLASFNRNQNINCTNLHKSLAVLCAVENAFKIVIYSEAELKCYND